MRTLTRILLASGGAAVTSLLPAFAWAQADINPKLPNVLLLVDTSGSMEYLIPPDPTNPLKYQLPGAIPGSACDVGVHNPPATTAVLNRWATLVSVLTGTVSNYTCERVDRVNNGDFNAEYKGLGAAPYDANYYLPFHRMYQNGCTVGPGTIDASWDWRRWPNYAPYQPFLNHTLLHPYSATAAGGLNSCNPTGSQAADGLIDVFNSRVRFGLMTFDSSTDKGTGTSGLQPATGPAYSQGTWSYYPDWVSGGTPAFGAPAGCTANVPPIEVGARNQAAPPWEGRLVPFGDPAATTTNNDQIQQEILAMRPYGATPLAGMLADAREFLFKDASTDIAGAKFGPGSDKYWIGGCRQTFVILLSDGAPNLDLRPECQGAGGTCPYDYPEDIAKDMRTNPPNPTQAVTTFVVGFGVSNPSALSTLPSPPNPLSCENLDVNLHCTGAVPDGVAACCALQKIAVQGGTGHAYFADNPTALKQQLSLILSQIAAGSTARTFPVFSTVPSVPGTQGALGKAASSYQFAASFTVPTGGELWYGNLVRERSTCNASGVATPDPIAKANGDDFAWNVNQNDAQFPRRFFTSIGTTTAGSIYSDRTIRPNIPADDGLGTYKPDSNVSAVPQIASSFVTTVQSHPEAFGITSSTPGCTNAFATTNPNLCTQYLMNWEIGENNVLPANLFVTRDPATCPATRICNKFGAIYHSTPAVTGAPREFLADETYTRYADERRLAPTKLYTATTDGQLHAFKVAAGDPADNFKIDKDHQNELWSFFPPHVLKQVMGSYNAQALLLDGAPVVNDVAGTKTGPTSYVLERTFGGQASTEWHRILVAGSGKTPNGGFYYALDVTDPKDGELNPPPPKFLWQLSTDSTGKPLFGGGTSTPAIATVAIGTGSSRKEVAVAILPGGTGAQTTCSGAFPASPVFAADSHMLANDSSNPNNQQGNTFPAVATKLHCWDYSANLARSSGNSLTIVRLDTGEVLMHFRGSAAIGYNGALSGTGPNIKDAPFVAPVTGVPVAFPGDTGQVADRIYVGDADGLLWRIDVADPTPTKWSASLAWDSYAMSGDLPGDREPIQIPPILSRDPIGNPVIIVATGDQDTFTAQPTKNRVWSLTETPIAKKVSQNWWFDFLPTDPAKAWRVTGPMALFNSVLYFATFLPEPSLACSDGKAAVWAVDYRRYDKNTMPRPIGEFPPGGQFADHSESDEGSVIFGVGVTQTASCAQDSSSPSGNAFASNPSAPDYQVVWQTGAGKGLATGGSSPVKNDPNVSGLQTMKVPPPGQSTKIDAWASLVE